MSTEIIAAGGVIATLITVLATFSIWRQSKLHQEALATLNHLHSKEAHAANHLYTRKASHLEKGGAMVGDLKFWAEKCLTPRTKTDFGSKKENAARMTRRFETLSNLAMRYPFAFNDIPNFNKTMGNLMGCVNRIEGLVTSEDPTSKPDKWQEAADSFHKTLAPLTKELQEEINKVISSTQQSKAG